jgi:signal peptidase II
MTRSKRKYVILGLLTLGVITLDQFTKYTITQRFRLNETIAILGGFFNLTYIRNTGAAFGILSHADPAFRIPFFVIVPIVALGAITYIFRKIPAEDVKLSTALSLVIGGAIGNLIDRVLLGYVVDFLDFHYRFEYHFPAFNVADSAICVGVGILMLDLMLAKEGNDRQPQPEKKGPEVDAPPAH